MRRRVAVLMGGRSSEHEVSLASAQSVIDALDGSRDEVIPVLISPEGVWSVDGEPVAAVAGPDGAGCLASLTGGPPRPVDVVFPVLHGPDGEDGTIQGALETAGIPYVGAGVASSAVAMDKAMFKIFLAHAGIPTPEHAVVTAGEWERDPDAVRARVAGIAGYPAFCKPARMGSSFGISPVADASALDGAIALALEFDSKVLVERAIGGQEVEVGVLGGPEPVVSPVGEIILPGGWYDYDAKYVPGRMQARIPADLPVEVAELVRRRALETFELIDCEGLARVDFFVEGDGGVLVSELNTMPGFTSTSVYPSLMKAAGVSYQRLTSTLIELALERARTRSSSPGRSSP